VIFPQLLLFATFGAQLPTGPGPYHLSRGDINRDGFPDLVIPCRGELRLPSEKQPANDTITVYFTAGSPQPVERKDFKVGFGPYTAVVSDLDKDGFLDVIVVNFQSNDGRHLTILWGQQEAPYLSSGVSLSITGDHVYDKSRTRSGEPIYPAPGLTSIAAVDANGDGRTDLIGVAWSSDFFVVLTNQGHRRFTQRTFLLAPGPRDVAAADFNRDGIVDLAFSIYSANLVEVWLGDGKGGFVHRQTFHSQGHTPYHLKAGDLDSDGYPDLVVGNRGPSDNVAAFRNEHGLFRFNGSYLTGTRHAGEATEDEIRDVMLFDADQDGKLDLLAACHISHKVITWAGTGNTDFGRGFREPAVQEFPGKGPRALIDLGGRIAVALFDANEVAIQVR
jgi:hypothetical protein